MRVAFYSPFIPVSHPNPSGARTQARAVVAALERKGHEVRVISEFRTSAFWRKPRRLRQLPRALWLAQRAARTFRPEAWLTVVSRRDVPDVLGPLLSWWLRVPYVIYKVPKGGTYSYLVRKEGVLKHLWRALPGYLINHLALSAADHVVAHKSADYEKYRSHPKIVTKLSLLLPAVSIEDFYPDPRERQEMRRMLEIPDDARVILSISRLSDRAGRKTPSLHFLIDCIAELVARGHLVRLVIAGEGETRAGLEEHASGLGNSVIFVGRVGYETVRSYYNAADVFAFPGLGEHIGMVYLEAQACGVPVVAFDNAGIPDVVRHGTTGFLVEPLNKESFVQRLDQLITDEALRQAMGHAGREHVRSRHELDAWGDQLSGFLTTSRPQKHQVS
jgi:glycosyltransferase involved in cell wall biosynthesis